MPINERIKLLRKTLKLSQTDFGKNLGVSRDVINNIDRSTVEPKPLLLEHICAVYNVNPDWLMNGTGEMFLERDTEDEIADFLAQLMCDDDESIRKRFVLALSKFDGDDWKTVEKFIDAFTQTEKDGE
jgi:transcriptional regulator with XRE-family HTH domain